MGDNDVTKTEAAGTKPPGHPLDPAKALAPPAATVGPTSPGLPDPAPDHAPESGGYDGHPPSTGPGNVKGGGYGAG